MRIASERNDDEVERNVRAIKVLVDEEPGLQRVRDAIKYVVTCRTIRCVSSSEKQGIEGY